MYTMQIPTFCITPRIYDIYIYMIHLSYISYIIYKHLIQTFNLGTQIVCTHNQWNNIKIDLNKEKFWSWYLVMDKFGFPKANSSPLHWQEDSLSYTVLIIALYLIWSKDHCKSWNQFGFQNLANDIVRVWT